MTQCRIPRKFLTPLDPRRLTNLNTLRNTVCGGQKIHDLFSTWGRELNKLWLRAGVGTKKNLVGNRNPLSGFRSGTRNPLEPKYYRFSWVPPGTQEPIIFYSLSRGTSI